MNIGKTGTYLLKQYASTLKINESVAYDIISNNKTMKTFIEQEPALSITSTTRNLHALMSGTIGRKNNFSDPITDHEIEIVKQLYKIDIRRNNNEYIEMMKLAANISKNWAEEFNRELVYTIEHVVYGLNNNLSPEEVIKNIQSDIPQHVSESTVKSIIKFINE